MMRRQKITSEQLMAITQKTVVERVTNTSYLTSAADLELTLNLFINQIDANGFEIIAKTPKKVKNESPS